MFLSAVGLGVTVTHSAHTQQPAQMARADTECGTEWNDWVCREVGRVTVWPGAEADTSAGISVRRRPKTVPSRSTIRVEPGGQASVRFRRKAHCDLGSAGAVTQIVTRVSPTTLFRQTAGFTECRSLDGSFLPAGFFCNATGECPVIFTSEGSYDLLGPQPLGAQISSATESRAAITACTKRFVLLVFDGERFERVEERSRVPLLYRIEVFQRSEDTPGGARLTWGYKLAAHSFC